jgi:hypothetical protein
MRRAVAVVVLGVATGTCAEHRPVGDGIVLAAAGSAPALASAPAPASAPALASALAPASASAPAPDLPPTDHFPAALAKQALDTLSPEVQKCRRGKVWGIATATVHFANDGTVSHVAISVPFTGTPTGACVSDTLATARVGPFGGKVGIVPYRFYVAPK